MIFIIFRPKFRVFSVNHLPLFFIFSRIEVVKFRSHTSPAKLAGYGEAKEGKYAQ